MYCVLKETLSVLVIVSVIVGLSIADLPDSQVDQYDHHQKKAFLEAYNKAYEEYDHDEHKTFAVAHKAAKQAGNKEKG